MSWQDGLLLVIAILVIVIYAFSDWLYDSRLARSPRVQWVSMNHDPKYGRWTLLDAYAACCQTLGRPQELDVRAHGRAQWTVAGAAVRGLEVLVNDARIALRNVPYPHQVTMTYRYVIPMPSIEPPSFEFVRYQPIGGVPPGEALGVVIEAPHQEFVWAFHATLMETFESAQTEALGSDVSGGLPLEKFEGRFLAREHKARTEVSYAQKLERAMMAGEKTWANI
jgi:hypothetical protein